MPRVGSPEAEKPRFPRPRDPLRQHPALALVLPVPALPVDPNRAGCLTATFCRLGTAGEGPDFPNFRADALRKTRLHIGALGWGRLWDWGRVDYTNGAARTQNTKHTDLTI